LIAVEQNYPGYGTFDDPAVYDLICAVDTVGVFQVESRADGLSAEIYLARLCQGRGSAANSLVAYLLGISLINPLAHDLVFERFVSTERQVAPDIDIDFDAVRREEVIQYVYQHYSTDHTAMACTLVTFCAQSAIRDLGKAFGLPPEVLDQVAGTGLRGMWGRVQLCTRQWVRLPPILLGRSSSMSASNWRVSRGTWASTTAVWSSPVHLSATDCRLNPPRWKIALWFSGTRKHSKMRGWSRSIYWAYGCSPLSLKLSRWWMSVRLRVVLMIPPRRSDLRGGHDGCLPGREPGTGTGAAPLATALLRRPDRVQPLNPAVKDAEGGTVQ
jgi:Bacterial DNA polymerase III alpha NTPase domain